MVKRGGGSIWQAAHIAVDLDAENKTENRGQKNFQGSALNE